MPYFKTCPRCGAHLDPGEVCDCRTLTEDDLNYSVSRMILDKERTLTGSTEPRKGEKIA